MQRSHFLPILGALALASCDPGNVKMGKGGPPDQNSGEIGRDRFAENEPAHERMAAEDSVGKPPPPRNLIAHVEDTCPVHHVKMTVCEVPIVFEETVEGGTESARLPASAAFPFGARKISSKGSKLLPGEALSALVYQCAACIAAQRAAEENRAPAAPTAALK